MNMLYPHPIPARVMVLHLLTSGSNSSPPFLQAEVCCLELRWLWACRGRESLRGTYVELKMQEVSQHSGGHAGEGGQERLEVDLQILLPLFHQTS